jgi:hypothetical protein
MLITTAPVSGVFLRGKFPHEDVCQVSLTIELQPPSTSPEPFATKVRLD